MCWSSPLFCLSLLVSWDHLHLTLLLRNICSFLWLFCLVGLLFVLFYLLIYIRDFLAYCVGYNRFPFTFLHQVNWHFSCVLLIASVFHPPLTIVLFFCILCSTSLIIMELLRPYLSYTPLFKFCKIVLLGVSICFACCLHSGFEVYHPPLAGFYVAYESSDALLISLSLYELTILPYSVS